MTREQARNEVEKPKLRSAIDVEVTGRMCTDAWLRCLPSLPVPVVYRLPDYVGG